MAGGTDILIAVRLALDWTFENYPNGESFGGAKEQLQKTFPPDAETDDYPQTLTLAGGDANQMWRDRRFVTTGSTTDDLDLSGSLTNVFGETVSFSTIRALIIHNRATVVGDDLDVGGAAANPLTSIHDGSGTAKYTIRASGIDFKWAPLDGYAVSGGSADTLRITHAGSTEAIYYDIVIIGTE